MNTTVMTKAVENKTVGFANKASRMQDRIARDEQELEELMAVSNEDTQEQTAVVESQEQEPETAEEKTFKKRYGDLRRHTQEEKEKYEDRIRKLEEQLTQTTKQEIKLPKTEKEIEMWAQKYPDVAAIIETIAIKKAKEQASEIESRVKLVDEMRAEATRQKAEAELMRAHPDFAEIRDSEEFHEWAETQPSMVQDALYNNDTDAKLAAWAIGLYKSEKGIRAQKAPNSKDAAKAVNTRTNRGTPQRNMASGTFSESQVSKMRDSEYEANQDAIMEAMRSGKFIYDITGSAR